MIVFATLIPYQAKAQDTWVPNGFSNVCDTASGFVRYNGRVGIRTNPIVPLHIHSSYCATGTTKIYPAIERLQTESTFGTYNFGQSAIQFWSGGILTGQDWAVSAIKPISNAIPQKFNTGDTTSPDNWLGGLAFYCSALGQRPTGGEIEVMRIVDEKVGIRTQTPLGQLDVNVGTANYHLPKISFTSGATSADATPGPQIRLYSPYGDPFDTTNVDRTSSYSWYIQSIRQYNPMCFSGVYGRNDGTGITTTMGALHFRAGYNTAAQKLVEDSSHNSGDIYRDDIGKESTVARMSLLSNGNLGINNEVPMARLQVTNGAVLFDDSLGSTPLRRVVTWTSDTTNVVTASEIGKGTRLMWIPDKAAFRAGIVDTFSEADGGSSHYYYDPDWTGSGTTISMTNKTSGWNSDKIGMYSFATGRNSRAEGIYDIAMGINNVANSRDKHGAIAIGHANKSTGEDAVCIGYRNRADTLSSIAIGRHNIVSGISATAIGSSDTVTSGYAFGGNCRADGGMAIGFGVKATTSRAICIGYDAKNTSGSSLVVAFNDTIYGTSLFVANQSVSIGVKREQNRFAVNGATAIGWGPEDPTLPNNSLGVGGKVGIGDSTPVNKLDVNGSVAIGFRDTASTVDTNSLAVARKVGIGTISTTSCTLGVNGTACIGWKGTGAVPSGVGGRSVSMLVDHAIIIGGTGSPLAPAYVSGDSNTTFNEFQVWGEAVKLEGLCNASWDVASDARYKKDVHPFEDGLQLLKQINPVRFKYNEKLGIQGSDKVEGIGVLAQDIQKIAPYTVRDNSLFKSIEIKKEKRYQVDDQDTVIKKVVDYSKVDKNQPDTLEEIERHHEYKDTTIYKPTKRWVIEPAEYRIDSMPLLTYNPSALTYVIINSIKELDSSRMTDKADVQTKITSLEEKNTSLQGQNDSLQLLLKNLQDRVTRIEAEKHIPLDGEQDIILEQNNPNPFADNTTITYYIPDKVQGDAEFVPAP